MSEMTQEREVRILEGAIEKFGKSAQVIVAIKECSELQKALTKWLRRKPDDSDEERERVVGNIHEEMADVAIMLNQLSLMFGDPTEQEIAKLERLEKKVFPVPKCLGM